MRKFIDDTFHSYAIRNMCFLRYKCMLLQQLIYQLGNRTIFSQQTPILKVLFIVPLIKSHVTFNRFQYVLITRALYIISHYELNIAHDTFFDDADFSRM